MVYASLQFRFTNDQRMQIEQINIQPNTKGKGTSHNNIVY